MKSRLLLPRCCCDAAFNTVSCPDCPNSPALAYQKYYARTSGVPLWSNATYTMNKVAGSGCRWFFTSGGVRMELDILEEYLTSGNVWWRWNNNITAVFPGVNLTYTYNAGGSDPDTPTCLWPGELESTAGTGHGTYGSVFISGVT